LNRLRLPGRTFITGTTAPTVSRCSDDPCFRNRSPNTEILSASEGPQDSDRARQSARGTAQAPSATPDHLSKHGRSHLFAALPIMTSRSLSGRWLPLTKSSCPQSHLVKCRKGQIPSSMAREPDENCQLPCLSRLGVVQFGKH
jgi:hypothetical protein